MDGKQELPTVDQGFTQQCETCTWWEKDSHASERNDRRVGRCFRFPPQYVPIFQSDSAGGGVHNVANFSHPLTSWANVCGEWQPEK